MEIEKELTIYKHSAYLRKGNNPFYYLSKAPGYSWTGYLKENREKYFNLSKIDIHPDCKEIMEGVFADYRDIKRVVFPKGLLRIGKRAFMNCGALKSIVINEGTKYIEEKAFSCCYELSKIELPSSIKEIGEGAFDSDWNIDKVIYHGSIEEWKSIKKKDWIRANSEFDIICNNGKIHVNAIKRYSVKDDKDKIVKEDFIKDQIEEIKNSDKEYKLTIAKTFLNSLIDKYYHHTTVDEKLINKIIKGISTLFIHSHGRINKNIYEMYLEIFDFDKNKLSYAVFKSLMSRYQPLEQFAFDMVTVRLSLMSRLYVAFIGVALISHDKKLTKKDEELIKKIIGPVVLRNPVYEYRETIK